MQRFSRDQVELNLAPMLDVVLLLLCFFFLTARFGVVDESTTTLAVDLPQTATSASLSPDAIIVDLSAQGEVALDGVVYRLSDAAFDSALQKRGGQDQDFVIRADAATPHSDVVQLMDHANSLGYTKLRVASRAKQ